jgi:hypothetical protein
VWGRRPLLPAMQPAPGEDQTCRGGVSGALAGRFVGCSTQDGGARGLHTLSAALRNRGPLDQHLGRWKPVGLCTGAP